MKTFAIALCGAVLVGFAAASAMAQPDMSLDQRFDAVQHGIDHGLADGALSRREYDHVEHLLRAEATLKNQMEAGGRPLSPEKVKHFEIDLDNIINEIHWDRQDWHRPW